ncbi:hypothetical protein CONCODRAFT_13784 [Conidiobolus coronatus NRRL 28638]|uniref:Uncharacterized protein n=1 Tax=Conidiobolus coronatus (strain ATCC 28846 / CBS 209.66 / NRRL 28638) TaxID=796925 RepID=A0A137NQ46_CONC2|nr:hypothetical protein CONCODRAFT_13784 [Conidiobolus coronatus NRRL 28638]|eukprot:KXN64861.1 hypothetical protein CONCODRAFT_13784 [Conidiobolus coronatus NRRL 28638]
MNSIATTYNISLDYLEIDNTIRISTKFANTHRFTLKSPSSLKLKSWYGDLNLIKYQKLPSGQYKGYPKFTTILKSIKLTPVPYIGYILTLKFLNNEEMQLEWRSSDLSTKYELYNYKTEEKLANFDIDIFSIKLHAKLNILGDVTGAGAGFKDYELIILSSVCLIINNLLR